MRRLEYEPLVGLLEAKLDLLGVDGFLWDLDDTILETTDYMGKHKINFSIWAAKYLEMRKELVIEVFFEAAHRAYDHLYVSPERWDLAVKMTAEKLTGDASRLDGGIEMIKKLFLDSPEMIQGARATLEIFQATGRKMALVTHAPMGWTEIKIKKNVLERYFDAVWSCDEKRPMSETNKKKGAELLDLPLYKLMGFGDNVNADVIPMRNLGIGAMAVKPKWKRSNGDLPPGIPLLESIAEAPEAILAL